MPKGGYQKPRKPAPASGPGKYSRRTDGGPQAARDLPNPEYGEGKDFKEAQRSAPMAGAPAQPTASDMPPPQSVETIPFDAPSLRPDEPVTAGAERGPGPGLASLGLTPPDQQMNADDIAAIRTYLPVFEWMASQPTSNASTRAFVRAIRSRLT